MSATKQPRCANSALSRTPRFALLAERALQIFAILIGGVFLLSGCIYLYLGRVTWLLGGDFWSVYAFAWNHTWFQSALFKQAGHVTFFPNLIGLANLHLFHGDVQMLFFAGLGLLFITVTLLLIPIWRDKTISLTGKILSTLVMVAGNFWMGRASITANGEFNCENSLTMSGAALAFLLIAKTPCSWTTTAIVVCAGFVASFSFGGGLAIWPTLLLLTWCLRLPWRTIVLLGTSALVVALVYQMVPVLPFSWPKASAVSLGNPISVLINFCRLVGSPLLYTIAAWRPEKPLADLEQSFAIALWTGLAGLVLAGIFVIPRMLWRDLKSGLESTGLSLLIFNFSALTLIAVGRLKSFDLEPLAPRYLFWSTLFWTSLILLAIERAEHLRWRRWPVLLLPFAVAIFAWPAHYQAWFWCKNVQIVYDKDATAVINGAFEAQRKQMLPLEFQQVFEERNHLASQLRSRRLDVFADGLQDWIGLREVDVFGTRHSPEGLHGQCRIDALGHSDNGASAARVSGQAFKHDEQSIPWTLVITDSNGVIRGVARSAPISPFINRTFYQNKFTGSIGFVGYIKDYNPELRYLVRGADHLTLSDEQIPVQQ